MSAHIHRINTRGCNISELPLYDVETRDLFENKTEVIWKCTDTPIKILRFNETWIRIDWTKLNYKPYCYYRQLMRGQHDNDFKYSMNFIK